MVINQTQPGFVEQFAEKKSAEKQLAFAAALLRPGFVG